MKWMILLTSIVLLALPCLAYTTAFARPNPVEKPTYLNRIVLIRHAEKGFAPSADSGVEALEEDADAEVDHKPHGHDGHDEHHKHHKHPHGRKDRSGPRPRPGPPRRSFWPPWPWGEPPERGHHGPPGHGHRGPPERPPHGPPPGRGPGRGGRGPPGDGGGGPGRKFPNGLSEIGKERAQYIRTLFGKDPEFDFGLIFAAPWDAENKTDERTYATVAPLAQDLGLEIDIACANAEPKCIADAIEEFAKDSEDDVSISWKHFDLNKIATALGASNARSIYPGERNDVIWIMQGGEIVEKRSMHCPGPDDERVDVGDPDLEVEEPGSSDVEPFGGLFGLLGALGDRIARIMGA